jgi:ferritin
MGDACVFDFLQKYRAIQTKSVFEYSDFLNKLALISDKENCTISELIEDAILDTYKKIICF